MSGVRLALAAALAAALLGAGVAAALVASDALAWASRLRAVDAALAAGAAGVRPAAATAFPAPAARALLGLDDDLAYRRALLLYASRTGTPDYDNGATRRTLEAEASLALARVEQRDPHPRRAAQAANLLGILAIRTPEPIAPGQPEAPERALAEFRAALRLDPGNEDAKANLELLLRELRARGEREGGTSGQSGRGGRRGAGASPPGRGY